MKFKLSGKRFMAIFFIVIMMGSTAAYALIQSFKSFTAPQNNPEDIPKTNVINYEVKSNVKDTLLKAGFTVINFYYRDGCIECTSAKTTLESLANKNTDQVLLQELKDTNGLVPRLVVSSYKDSMELTNATSDEINGVLCDLMAAPPAELKCALRNI
ncbi:MAG: hypothetical protein V1944_01220 [Candidatus Aenigmatarchaeota archaeon]